MSARPESERSDWTEQDLLTRVEADARLRTEITDTRSELATTTAPEARELLERRLQALTERAGEPPAN